VNYVDTVSFASQSAVTQTHCASESVVSSHILECNYYLA